jgi:hypothetical protein
LLGRCASKRAYASRLVEIEPRMQTPLRVTLSRGELRAG